MKLYFHTDGSCFLIVDETIAKILWHSNNYELLKVYPDDSEGVIEEIEEIESAFDNGVMVGVYLERIIEKDVNFAPVLEEIVLQRLYSKLPMNNLELAKDFIKANDIIDLTHLSKNIDLFILAKETGAIVKNN